MPSVPKKNPMSGSALLGQELKRLRGTRTLREICDVTSSPALSARVAPISPATLSEIECGKTLPQLATLHALSAVYKVSMSQLMAYVTEEKLAKELEGAKGATLEELQSAFARLLGERAWADALTIALVGERSADTPGRQVAWRGNRASCLAKLGMLDEAIGLFSECCESPALTPVQRHSMMVNLAVAHVAAGNLWQASMFLQQAELLGQMGAADPAAAANIGILRAQVVLARRHYEMPVAESEIREALHLFESALASTSSGDDIARLRLHIEVAAVHSALGNHLDAARDAMAALLEAETLKNPSLSAQAHFVVAEIARSSGDLDAAVVHFAASVPLSEQAMQNQRAFDACFRLYLLLQEDLPERAASFLKRCDTLAPLVTARTPLWKAYQNVVRTGT